MTSNHPWQPQILDLTTPSNQQQFDILHSESKIWRVHDTIIQQVEDLVRTRNPRWIKQRVDDAHVQAKIDELLSGVPLNEYGRWIYFPWSGEMIHLLPPEELRDMIAMSYVARRMRGHQILDNGQQHRLMEQT